MRTKARQTDLPQLSWADCNNRYCLRQQIIGAELQPLESPPTVEITGLELLLAASEQDSSLDDDQSYNSYANDSLLLAQEKYSPSILMSSSAHHLKNRRFSNSSFGFEENDSFHGKRRMSMESQHSTRRPSLDTFDSGVNDPLCRKHGHAHGTSSKPLRRFSNYSEYAMDSIDPRINNPKKLEVDELDRSSYHEVMKRRMSNETCNSFSHDLLESMEVRGGASRAA